MRVQTLPNPVTAIAGLQAQITALSGDVSSLTTDVSSLQTSVTALQSLAVLGGKFNRTALQNGTYSAAIGDCVSIDSTGGIVTVNLPAITSGIDGRGILIMDFYGLNTQGCNTTPHGTDTVEGLAAGDQPGFVGPQFSAWLIADNSTKNWGIVVLGAF